MSQTNRSAREPLIERFIHLTPLIGRRLALTYPPELRQEVGRATVHQIDALMHLQPEARSMSEFARLLGVSDASATALADRLVAQALVERSVHPRDRRVVTLALTARGRDFVDRLQEARRHALLAAFNRLDDGQLENLVWALEALAAGLDRDTSPAAAAAASVEAGS